MGADAIRTNALQHSRFSLNGSAEDIPLSVLMNRHNTDKLYLHHYDREYARHFEPRRHEPISILEIGVGGYAHPDKGGESLKVWRDYFPNARITAIDICEKTLDLGLRVTIRQCDQSNQPALLQLNEEHGPFDIIIDDGSHHQAHVLASFITLFPVLSPGGIYVIEDMATAYWPEYGGDPENPPTVLLLTGLLNGMNHQFWKTLRPGETDPLSVKSVHVSREIAFIYKQ
jgi:8-demethyl-8-alpha-L-rhamnosyltetracenomycin-C 2'-O-methyltransferase